MIKVLNFDSFLINFKRLLIFYLFLYIYIEVLMINLFYIYDILILKFLSAIDN